MCTRGRGGKLSTVQIIFSVLKQRENPNSYQDHVLQPSDSTAASCSPAAQPLAEVRGEPSPRDVHGEQLPQLAEAPDPGLLSPLTTPPPTHFFRWPPFLSSSCTVSLLAGWQERSQRVSLSFPPTGTASTQEFYTTLVVRAGSTPGPSQTVGQGEVQGGALTWSRSFHESAAKPRRQSQNDSKALYFPPDESARSWMSPLTAAQ